MPTMEEIFKAINDAYHPYYFVYDGVSYVVYGGSRRIHYASGGDLWSPFPTLPDHVEEALRIYFDLNLNVSMRLQEYLISAGITKEEDYVTSRDDSVP